MGIQCLKQSSSNTIDINNNKYTFAALKMIKVL